MSPHLLLPNHSINSRTTVFSINLWKYPIQMCFNPFSFIFRLLQCRRETDTTNDIIAFFETSSDTMKLVDKNSGNLKLYSIKYVTSTGNNQIQSASDSETQE